MCGTRPRRLLVPAGQKGGPATGAEPNVAGAAVQGQPGDGWENLRPSQVFLPCFCWRRTGDCASFLLSDMNYLDFQGIFLINKKAIFKY